MADAKGVPDLARPRARAQLLATAERRSPAAVVGHLLAVQAQDFASVPLALRARSRGLTRSAINDALDSGELVIGWLNRGTLHMVRRDDYWWLHALTAPTIRTANARRLEQEGVTDPDRQVRAMAKALADGPMLRREIGERIGARAAALTHLLVAATLGGVVVRGPIHGNEQTFMLTRDHLGEPPRIDRQKALRELARRYLDGHGPATEADLAYWAKLPLRDVRVGTSCLGNAYAEGAWPSKRGRPIPPRLLPPFDPYILGWRDRSFAIPPGLAKRVMPGGGMFRAVVLVDGAVAGTWSRAGGRVAIDVGRAAVRGLEAEIADVERFLAEPY